MIISFEQKFCGLLQKETEEEWLQQNKEALEEYNRWVEKNGVFSDGLRKF